MPELEYLNFDLELEKADGGYRAHVLSSPAGEARTVMGPLPAPGADASPQVVGGALFDAVFREDVLGCLRRSLDAAKRADRGLRIRLRLSETPELAGLPWELLYDRQGANFLALSRETPLVRYLDLPEPAESISPEIKLRVLAVIASPSDYPALDVEREWQNLKVGLADLEAHGVVTVDRLQPTTVDALQKQLLKQEYHILHFLGHGDYSEDDKDGVLLLTAADGTGDAVSGETFSTLLRDQNSLRLALISACRGAVSGEHDPYSGVAQRLVRGGVPAVIAMRSSISDPAAVALARSFYTALATGAAVDEAMAEARKTLYSGGFPNDWATAVLYMRAADGHLWRPDPEVRRRRLRRTLTAVGAAVAVVLLAAFAWWFTRPTRMPDVNTMNIAVLDPGEEQADGTLARAPDAELIRTWMVEALSTANGPNAAAQRIGLWHNGLPVSQKRDRLPILRESKADERENEAHIEADGIGATVLITGRIRQVNGKRELTPEFYVFSRLTGEAKEAVGYFTLGGPIPLEDLAKDDFNRAFVASQLTERVSLLEGVLLALRQDLFGQHAEALRALEDLAAQRGLPAGAAQLQQAATQPAAAAGESDSGLDVLYYFLGREALFLEQSDAAVEYAQRAISINKNNVRAYIVKGGALLAQSKGLSTSEVALQKDGLQDQAEQAYRAAVTLVEDPSGGATSIVTAIARLGMGDALVTRGEWVYRESQSAETDRVADDLLQKGIDALPRDVVTRLDEAGQYRMVAQYHASVGAAKYYQGVMAASAQDTPRAEGVLKEAKAHFEACKAQVDRAREDQTLATRIAAGCERALDGVNGQLAKLGG